MAPAAQITSVEAIENFRARLIVYLGQMRPLLDEINHEAKQTKLWIQNDQQRYWRDQMRLRYRKLEESRGELFAARLSSFQEASSLHYMAVQRAQRAVTEAEEKLGVIKKWNLELEDTAAPFTRQIELLQGFLTADMGRAVTFLDQVLEALAAYREVARPRTAEPGTAENQP
ncbi:MAG TPA: hypothetical protein VNX46_12465 [Candidatus Acidoferrum sp.]|nr:hypothetical protein [Candidatus Acidoferrum sp.]